MSFHDKEFIEDAVAVFDPGTQTGSGVLVSLTQKRLRIHDSFSMDTLGVAAFTPEQYVEMASDRLVEWGIGYANDCEEIVDRVIIARTYIIEMPAPAAGRRGRTPSLSILMKVALNAADIGFRVARDTGRTVKTFRADMLRRTGRIMSNAERPKTFTRIYGDVASDEHVVDAGLIAAKHFNVF